MGGAVPWLAGVKLLSCDAKVCITCHGTRLGDIQEYARTQAWKLRQQDSVRGLCRAEEDNPDMVFYVLPIGRGAFSKYCPESYPRATSWLAAKKKKDFYTHTAPGYVAWKIRDWFRRTLQRTKHTPLLNPLMKGIIRRVLILNVIAWLKGKLFLVSSMLMHPKKA